MKRWHGPKGLYVEAPDIDAFMVEIAAVCVKHKMSISHEDGQGAFEIEHFDKDNIMWLQAAHDMRGTP